ncbi:SurA N-terminal domain-containing protein [Arenibaculum pallidiluteum]|uniref:SurA N-terminal domain-containing protein n=1 Tax=Arenibaculum pallidiluteum TaxID=2812559 RepID=UPI001A95C469|nr:SurA N-terminal domain-containing protein [Arenibaculum pallidiluteum]
MLQALRSTVGSWVAKILFVLLIASFGIWGIGDMFRGRVENDVATVGDVTIGRQQVDQAFRTELERLRQVLGSITPEQARAFGLLDRTVEQLVERALLDQEAADMGLRTSQELVLSTLRREPAFRNAQGQFDPQQFRRALASSGLTEQGYVQLVEGEIARRTMAAAVTEGVRAPTPLVESVFRRQAERRVAETILLPESAAPDPGQPDQDTVAKYHQDRAVRFTAPEYRGLTVAALTVEDVAKDIEVPEEELRAAYDSRANEFGTPERRDLEQVLASDEAAAARIAEAARQAGGNLAEAATAAGLDAQPLGGFTREDLLDGLREPVFAAAEGTIVGPLRSELGWHVVKVTKVIPATSQTFEQARGQIADQIRREQAANSIYDVANKLEDALAGGASVQEAAQRLGLRLVRVPAVDANGQTPEGTPAADLPSPRLVVEEAFRLGQGEHGRALDTPEGGYVVVQVDEIRPAALRPLEQVRDQVVAAWQAERRAESTAKRAEEVVAELRAGRTVEDVARAAGGTAGRTEPLTRGSRSAGGLPPLLIEQLFEMKQGEVASAATEGGQMVVKLVEIQVPDPAADPSQLDQVRLTLSQGMQQDVLASYTRALRGEYGVTVNRTVLETLYGTD